MSYCALIYIKDGKQASSQEFRNAWGGAAYIWDYLFNRYLKDPRKEYDTWLTSASASDAPLWKLAGRKDIPRFLRAVHASTFDRAYVAREHFKQFTADLREFVLVAGTEGQRVIHLLDWADAIDALGDDIDAVGFHGTSVSENLWFVYDAEKDESVPYDMSARDEHFEVYEWLDEVDSEVAASP